MLTNSENIFQNNGTIETGLSGHHKMIITMLKTYRSHKNLDISKYKNAQKQNLGQLNKETRVLQGTVPE